eukprot:scaffold153728_cov16-Tisochrysis_lutea.AAC.2
MLRVYRACAAHLQEANAMVSNCMGVYGGRPHRCEQGQGVWISEGKTMPLVAECLYACKHIYRQAPLWCWQGLWMELNLSNALLAKFVCVCVCVCVSARVCVLRQTRILCRKLYANSLKARQSGSPASQPENQSARILVKKLYQYGTHQVRQVAAHKGRVCPAAAAAAAAMLVGCR